MDDDDDDGLIKNRTGEQVGLPVLLRGEYHQYMLPRISEVAGVASRIRRYASQLVNLYLQDAANAMPNKPALETFFNQAQGLFCEEFAPQARKPIMPA
jgi:hypothetical protein